MKLDHVSFGWQELVFSGRVGPDGYLRTHLLNDDKIAFLQLFERFVRRGHLRALSSDGPVLTVTVMVHGNVVLPSFAGVMASPDHPRCRSIATTVHTEEESVINDLKKTPFYVGSNRAMRPGWAKSTLEEAIDHAKELCRETGEDQFVVQVVRVVKRQAPPITIEKVVPRRG